MLVLERKPDESVSLFFGGSFIGRVTMFENKNGKARIGFDLDPNVRIVRDEVLDAERKLANDRVPALV